MKEGFSETQYEGSGTRSSGAGPRVSKFPKKRPQGHSVPAKANKSKASPSKARPHAQAPVQQNGGSEVSSVGATGVSTAQGNGLCDVGSLEHRASGGDEQLSDEDEVTARSDTSPSERLFPRYGSKMPVSPRRAKSMYGGGWGSHSRAEKSASGPESMSTSSCANIAKLNQHVASISGTAAPKGEVWHEQLSTTSVDGSQLVVTNQQLMVGGQAQPGPRKPIVPYRAPAKLSRNGARGSGSVKPGKQSTGGGISHKDRRYSGDYGRGTKPSMDSGNEGGRSMRVGGQSHSSLQRPLVPSKVSDSSADAPLVSSASFPPRPAILRNRIVSPGFSSDSDENPATDGPHSPKVVRATAQSSSERETPRSAMPWTVQSKPQRTSKWTLSTPLSDRSHHQAHSRHRKNVPMTSMEQEAAGAPQSAPLSPSVSDTFNAHFASREDQCWLVEEDRPHLGLNPEAMDWDFPFGCPRRNSNPVSEISGVSEFSGYDYRERDSDVRSRSGSLGLGRFDGQAFQSLGNEAWDMGAPRPLNGMGPKNEQKKHVDAEGTRWAQRVGTLATDLEHGISDLSMDGAGTKVKQGKANMLQESTRELPYRHVQQDILQSPKGRTHTVNQGNRGTGKKADFPWTDDGTSSGYTNRLVPFKPTSQDWRKGSAAHSRYSSWEQQARDDDISIPGYDGRPSSAFGERRRSIGSRVLQVAVVAAAGVAAIVFGGELLKVLEDDDSDDDDDDERK